MKDRAAFLAERAHAIGGSDVAALANLEHGCERALWYDKTGKPADFPFTGNKATARGSALEPFAVEEFVRESGCVALTHEWVQDRQRTYAGVHPDRQLFRPLDVDLHHSPGLLEVKVPSAFHYYKIRAEGPPWGAQLQLQWGLAMTGWTWGVIWCFNADAWTGAAFEHVRDEELIGQLLDLADNHAATWDLAENPFPRLDATQDRRCRKCPWRRTCQGIDREWLPPDERDLPHEAIQDESYFDLVTDYAAAQANLRAAEKALEVAKAKIIANLGGQPARVRCAAGRITYAPVYVKEHTVKEKRYFQLRVVPATPTEETDE